jgi:N-acetylglutamate synthase-like GNAT family acetyltransferase
MEAFPMQDRLRASVSVPSELLEAAARAAEQQGISRAKVLSDWLQSGFRLVRQDALTDAYDAFYAEGDPEPVPARARRERAARFDARWD